MRNPVVAADYQRQLAAAADGSRSPIANISCNHQLGRMYILSEDGTVSCYDNSDDQMRLYRMVKLEFDGVAEKWFKIDYIAAIASIVCISFYGSIVVIEEGDDTSLPSQSAPDQIGVIENGISSAAWNPDFSSLLLLTNNDTLLAMSVGWEVLAEVPTLPRAPGTPTTISFRGDGDMVAILSTDQGDDLARVRVYNRSLEVIATNRNVQESVPMPGLGSAMAFASNGSYIAVRQASKTGEAVLLLEKNGLRHGQVDILPPTTHAGSSWTVHTVTWDATCQYFAVYWRDAHGAGCVQIYTRSNYCWSLKQHFHCTDSSTSTHFLGFDTERSHRLYLVNQHILRVVDLASTIHACAVVDDHPVCVVHGSTLRYTPLGVAVVPPPMCLYSVDLPADVVPRAQSFAKAGAHWYHAVLEEETGGIALYRGGEPVRAPPRLVTRFHLREVCAYTEGRDVLDETVFRSLSLYIEPCPAQDKEGDAVTFRMALAGSSLRGDVLCEMLGEMSPETPRTVRVVTDLCGQVYHLHYTCCPGSLPGQHDGDDDDDDPARDKQAREGDVRLVFGLQSSAALFDIHAVAPAMWTDNRVVSWTHDMHVDAWVSIPEVCPDFLVVPMQDHDHDHDVVVVALSSKHRLYLNDVFVHAAVSSYLVHPRTRLLVVCGLQSIRCVDLAAVRLHGAAEEVAVSFGDARPVERGARLVANIAQGTRVVTQMPRGNLETFEPRGLVLRTIQSLVVGPAATAQSVYLAVRLVRRQKVDWNLLLARGLRQAVVRHVHTWVDTVCTRGEVDMLAQMVAAFQAQDAVRGDGLLRGLAPSPGEGQGEDDVPGDKRVVEVCAAVRQALLQVLARRLDPQTSSSSSSSSSSPLAVVHCVLSCLGKEGRVADSFALLQLLCRHRDGHEDRDGPSSSSAGWEVQTAALEAVWRDLDAAALSATGPTRTVSASAEASRGRIADDWCAVRDIVDRHYARGVPGVSVAQCVRYLTFLHTPEALYRHALLAGDLALCRALVYASQLDPQTCLPLLARFQALSQLSARAVPSPAGDAPSVLDRRLVDWLHMHLEVAVHLHEPLAVLRYWVWLCEVLYWQEVVQTRDVGTVYLATVWPVLPRRLAVVLDMLRTADRAVLLGEDVRGLCLQLDRRLLAISPRPGTGTGPGSGTVPEPVTVVLARDVVNAYHAALADRLQTSPSSSSSSSSCSMGTTPAGADQAIACYLRMRPPHITAAIDTAMRAMDYPRAFSLALQASHPLATPAAGEGVPVPGPGEDWRAMLLSQRPAEVWAGDTPGMTRTGKGYTPQEVAQRIVSALLEQQTAGAGVGGGLSRSASLFPDVLPHGGDALSSPAFPLDSVVPFVARLARDWLHDLETAVHTLCGGRHYVLARDCASPTRPDLVHEVVAAVRSTAEEVVEAVHEMARDYVRHTDVLAGLWAQPAERLAALAGLDTALYTALHPDDARDDVSDTASVYTAATAYSQASSVHSRASATSTLSLLSNASQRTATTTTTTSFSIQGLDHALLSRGTADPLGGDALPSSGKRVHKRDSSARRQKRIARSQAKGLCRDLFHTQAEQEACEGLWRIARTLPQATELVTELCTVLLGSDSPADLALACACQQAMQAWVCAMQATAPPYAPAYPASWLEGRQMGCVRGFQSPHAVVQDWVQARRDVTDADVKAVADHVQGSWVRVCARGIQTWMDRRLVALLSDTL